MSSSPGSRLPPGFMKIAVPRLRTTSMRPASSRITAVTMSMLGEVMRPA
jgi:hypothetical protein